jgi:hypothetical protein
LADAADLLVLSMEVEIGRDSVRFALHGTNPTAQPILLEFDHARPVEFEVHDASGAVIWRWPGDGRAADAGEARIAPEETVQYEGVWRPGGQAGAFTVIGRLLTRAGTREQRTEFEI